VTMTPSEYEAHVAELVRQLDFFENGCVYRNRKFAGVRQPGEYEIDVAVQTKLSGKLDFLLIIECKNWSRPVDRPVVQKLAQTRDAIAAHKAAVVSPVGFTKEAVDVARTLGIALWVISQASWETIMGLMGPPRVVYERYQTRRDFIQQLGIKMSHGGYTREVALILVDFAHASKRLDEARSWVRFTHQCVGGSAVGPGSNEPGVDLRLAISSLADEIGQLAGLPVPAGTMGGWE
jgi:Restriction endonuclease